MTSKILPRALSKADALGALIDHYQLPTINLWHGPVQEALDDAAIRAGQDILNAIPIVSKDTVEEATELPFFAPAVRRVREPVHLTTRPGAFPTACGPLQHAPFDILRLPNGYFAHVGGAPLAFAPDGRRVIEEYSSRYAQLINFYDFDPHSMIDSAVVLDGTAIVISDEIRPLNYCHWMVDWLPRLAFAGHATRCPDTFVITTPLELSYQRETLRCCGFSDDRIIELDDFRAVRARELLISNDLANLPHPAHSGAPWALSYLRASLGCSSEKAKEDSRGRKLFISRGDTAGRAVVNENELLTALTSRGYEQVVLTNLSVADQVSMFAAATHIVAPHGAGLTNILFCGPDTVVIELFSPSYSLGTYYVLSAVQEFSYYSYVAQSTTLKQHGQFEDILVDVQDFLYRAKDLL